MFRSFADQSDHSEYAYDEAEPDYCTDSCGREKGHYGSTKAAAIALELATAKAHAEHRIAPVRYYQCSNPSKACFLEFHLTSKNVT